jgi:hypothetical protein|tara:strand:+ start:2233 stop:2913 length:681 start_codon:yes stop_codon:yes gene_type:complete
MTKKTLGWNPTYFGEPKKGSLASVVADITNKQNAMVGDKPEVQDSVVVQAEKAKQEAANPAQQAAIAVNMKKQGKKPKNEDDAADMRDKNKKDAKGETPIKVHGEDLNKEIENAKMAKVKSLVDTIKDMFYTSEAKHHDKDKEKEEGNAFTKALMAAKEKGEKTFTVAGKHYDVKKEEDKLDPVNKDAVKKKFKDRKDKDIDNDGDVDSSDKYLHKRRQAISKEID